MYKDKLMQFRCQHHVPDHTPFRLNRLLLITTLNQSATCTSLSLAPNFIISTVPFRETETSRARMT